MPGEQWDVYVLDEVRGWIDGLDAPAHARVVQAIDLLAEVGPGLGRKSGRWNDWYRDAIPVAEQRYAIYLKERGQEEGDRP